jgi:hypothetical protein
MTRASTVGPGRDRGASTLLARISVKGSSTLPLTYAPQTITPPTTNLAGFQALGYEGIVRAVARASAFDAETMAGTMAYPVSNLAARELSRRITNWLQGEPVDNQDLLDRIARSATILRAAAAAIDQFAAVVIANPGTVAPQKGVSPHIKSAAGHPVRRTWP